MEELSRIVLITGASRGIGRAIALRLADQGHTIAINYNSHKEDAEEVLREINKRGSSGMIVKANVSKLEEVQEMVKQVENSLGPVEILYNNAGIISDSLLMRMKPEDFDKVIDTNLKGTFYCTKLCINNMIKNRWGRVINISSVVGIRGNIGQSNYSASKAGIHSFTKSVAKEVATRNITVNVIAPGYISTATTDVLSDKVKKEVMSWIPMQRFGEPDEIAPIAAFLSREEARYITGEIIRVDGGMAI
ncbi:MAG: 3-oxoacyl-[acyl-carrier-protein] reductase [Chloroflexi bacterium]|nr:3-oxoacyl-[acyl-carrier-protein] reductase [Chloroflexota bacterium]|tara:strand:+ start:21857 stop:22600 length:744 start_codon:yes stop_codon:yes gene_type:complete